MVAAPFPGMILLLALAGCAALPARGGVPAPLDPSAPVTPQQWEFWQAVSALDLRHAERRSPDGEHRRLVRAIRQVLDGRMQDAEAPLSSLAESSGDSLLRGVSHIALSAALEYQGKWTELDALSRGPNRTRPTAGTERAGIEAWAGAMRLAPPTEIRFPREAVELPFLPAVTGTPVVSVKVNGVSRWFWIDTGSSVTLVASDVAAEAGVAPLVADTLQMVTAVGVTRAQPALLRLLEIGGLQVANQPAGILDARDLALEIDGGPGEPGFVKIDGVIGMDVIRRLNLEIDFFRNRVRITRPPPAEAVDEERNLLWLGYPLVRLEQPDGRPLYFGLDTGADRTYATEALLRKMPRRWLRKQRQRIAGFGGDTTLTVPTIPSLSVRLGGRSFQLSDVAVHGTRRMGFVQLDGVLGTDTALGLRVRIDVTNGVFLIGLPYGGRVELPRVSEPGPGTVPGREPPRPRRPGWRP